MSKLPLQAAVGVIVVVLASSALADTGATGCTDLGGIPETPRIDYESQIQPIFDGCTGCHGQSGSANLDLRPGEAYDNLIGIDSLTNPDFLRVEPFEPETSILLTATNCETPNGPGFQMPGTDSVQRALIRDWIAQGALPEPAGSPEAIAVPVDSTGLLAAIMGLLLLLAGIHFRKTA